MDKIISFSLFGHNARYWDSIPVCVASYLIAYPNFGIRFYCAKDILSHPGCEFLLDLTHCLNVELLCIDWSYKDTEPTIWRMMPLWEKDINIFLCRDIDSIATSYEKRATEAFLNSRFAIHGIRTYVLHTTELMAGLCGFKANMIRNILLCKRFEEYANFGINHVSYCATGQWGCDQMLLKKFFYSGPRANYFYSLSLDTMLGSATKLPNYKGNYLPNSCYSNIDISKYEFLFSVTDKMIKFVAEPSHYNNEQNKIVLSLDHDICRTIKHLTQKHSYYKKIWQ